MKQEIIVGDTKVQVGLDRMVIGFPYPKKLENNLAAPPTKLQLAKFEEDKKEFLSKMLYTQSIIKENFDYYVAKTNNKFLKRFNVLSGGSLLCTFTFGYCHGNGVMNFEFNPSKLGEQKLAELFGWIDVFFYNGYQELYTKGVVSHAEFFVDVPDEDLSGLVLIDEGRRAYTLYEGTTYLGRRKSELSVAMYDKAKELEQTTDGKLVRVEARLCDRDIRFQDLVENDLFNPFGNSMVVNVTKLKFIAQEFNKSQFVNHIKELGLSGSGINVHTRKKMLAKLKENTVDWWQPETFWAAHREMLMKFRPNHVGGIA